MENLEVALVSPYRGPDFDDGSPADSGLLEFTRNIATAMARFVRVHVITHRHGSSVRDWQDGSVLVHAAYRRGSWFGPLQVLAWATRSTCDVIHFQHELFAFGNPVCALILPPVMFLLRISGRTVVTTIHGIIPLGTIDASFIAKNGSRLSPAVARRGWRLLLRLTCAASTTVIVHEESHKRSLRSEYGVRTPIAVIPLAIQPSAPVSAAERDGARAGMQIDSSAEIVLFFGYFAGYKGLDELCDAIPLLLAARPRLHVIVAGEVPARLGDATAVSARVDALAASHRRMHRLGYVPNVDVRRVFAAADVLILPYTSGIASSGPFSLAAVHGIPSIASRRLHQDERDTFAFEPDVAGIVQGVTSFFDDASAREQARRHMERVRRERSSDVVAAHTIEAYGR